MTGLILCGLAAWLFVVGFALALCAAAGGADDAAERSFHNESQGGA